MLSKNMTIEQMLEAVRLAIPEEIRSEFNVRLPIYGCPDNLGNYGFIIEHPVPIPCTDHDSVKATVGWMPSEMGKGFAQLVKDRTTQSLMTILDFYGLAVREDRIIDRKSLSTGPFSEKVSILLKTPGGNPALIEVSPQGVSIKEHAK